MNATKAIGILLSGVLIVGCAQDKHERTVGKDRFDRASNRIVQDTLPSSPQTNAELPKLYTSSTNLSPTSSNSASRIYSEAPRRSPLSEAAVQKPLVNSDAVDVGFNDEDRLLTQHLRSIWSDDSALVNTIQGVKITASDGRIVLSGSVRSTDEKRRLEILARATAGVASVENQIEVRPIP